jgi:hypothetical protein
MKITDLKLNDGNPRQIKDARMDKLIESIKTFPKMMKLRPIIIDNEGLIIGGNMRYRALLALGYKDIPAGWVKSADELTEDEKKRFIIVDNVQFGEWETDILANEWNAELLDDWGIDMNVWPAVEPVKLEETDDDKTKTFHTEVMLVRNAIAKRIEENEKIELSAAYMKAEGMIMEAIKKL